MQGCGARLPLAPHIGYPLHDIAFPVAVCPDHGMYSARNKRVLKRWICLPKILCYDKAILFKRNKRMDTKANVLFRITCFL